MNYFYVCVPSLRLHLCDKKACSVFAGRLTSLVMQVFLHLCTQEGSAPDCDTGEGR